LSLGHKTTGLNFYGERTSNQPLPVEEYLRASAENCSVIKGIAQVENAPLAPENKNTENTLARIKSEKLLKIIRIT